MQGSRDRSRSPEARSPSGSPSRPRRSSYTRPGQPLKMVATSGNVSPTGPPMISLNGDPFGVNKVPVVRGRPVESGGTYYATQYEVLPHHQNDPLLEEHRQVCLKAGLCNIKCKDILPLLSQAATDGRLSCDIFVQKVSQLLSDPNFRKANPDVGMPQKNDLVRAFRVFDADHNGFIDTMELVCGVSMFTRGDEEQKIHSIFECVDRNHDNLVSYDEMRDFFHATFKIVLTPSVMATLTQQAVKVEGPYHLADLTTREAFQNLRHDRETPLNFTDFMTWFRTPQNDPNFVNSPFHGLLSVPNKS